MNAWDPHPLTVDQPDLMEVAVAGTAAWLTAVAIVAAALLVVLVLLGLRRLVR